nr:unnamed protein product [Callosobruchus analis]
MVLTREIREEIKYSVSSSIHSILKEEQFIDMLIEKVTDGVTKTISAKIAQLEQKIDKISQENSLVVKELREETSILRQENEYLMQKYDRLDQEARCNNLRIFNIKEDPQEILSDVLVEKFQSRLGIKVNKDEILVCTRFGKKQDRRPRGILLKLSNINTKQAIYNKNKQFRGTGIVVKEDLTEHRIKIMQAAIEKTSLKSVWSYNGLVYAMKDNKRQLIKDKNDLQKL